MADARVTGSCCAKTSRRGSPAGAPTTTRPSRGVEPARAVASVPAQLLIAVELAAMTLGSAMFGSIVAGCASRGATTTLASRTARDDDPDAAAVHGRLEDARWGTFRSRRFGLSVPLPDGRKWRIDDHQTPWMRATHSSSGSTLVARTWIERDPVSREHCYERARTWDRELGLPAVSDLPVTTSDTQAAPPPLTAPSLENAVAAGFARPSGLIEDRLRDLWPDLPARVLIGVDPDPEPAGARPPRASGFVAASAAAVRKCIFVAFRTSSDDASELASRLALVSSRVLGFIDLGSPLSPARLPVSPGAPNSPRSSASAP